MFYYKVIGGPMDGDVAHLEYDYAPGTLAQVGSANVDLRWEHWYVVAEVYELLYVCAKVREKAVKK